jgi:uncharacterized protein
MQFTQELDHSTYVIRSYGPGEVVVTEPLSEDAMQAAAAGDQEALRLKRRTLRESSIVTPRKILKWPPASADSLAAEHLADIVREEPEIVIIGTGKRSTWPSASVTRALTARGIGVEIMDTAAACRTYNILMYEGRKVVVALMMI